MFVCLDFQIALCLIVKPDMYLIVKCLAGW